MQSEKEKSTEIPGWTYTYATTDDGRRFRLAQGCLLYTSDAADE